MGGWGGLGVGGGWKEGMMIQVKENGGENAEDRPWMAQSIQLVSLPRRNRHYSGGRMIRRRADPPLNLLFCFIIWSSSAVILLDLFRRCSCFRLQIAYCIVCYCLVHTLISLSFILCPLLVDYEPTKMAVINPTSINSWYWRAKSKMTTTSLIINEYFLIFFDLIWFDFFSNLTESCLLSLQSVA